MKLYVVIAGIYYEGEVVDSIKLFQDEKDAKAYANDLECGTNQSGFNDDELYYEYTVIQERIVH